MMPMSSVWSCHPGRPTSMPTRVPGLPRTNNELEGHLRETRRRLLRATGQQGQTQWTLHRQGAWELLPQPPTEAKFQEAFRQTPPEDWAQERQCFAAHRQRFRMQSRSLRQTSRAIRSPASAVASTTAYRHRVTFAVLRLGSCWMPGSYTPHKGLKHLI